MSVDAPFAEGEENSLLDVLPNSNAQMADNVLVQESLRDEISSALKSLNERERNIIEAFFPFLTEADIFQISRHIFLPIKIIRI